VTDQQLTTHCTTCGHAIRQGDSFCTDCGTSVSGEPRKPLFADEVPAEAAYVSDHRPPPETRPPAAVGHRRRRRGGAVALLIAALVLLAAGIALGINLSDGGGTAGASGTSEEGSTGAPSPTPSEPLATGAAGPPMQPQDQLQLITKRDGPRVRRLTDSWVPQLAALAPGAGDDRSWSEALAHFNDLKRAYPDALLLDTADWPHSYEKGGMYAVVLPVPRAESPPVLAWCRANKHSPGQDCAAKNLATSGSWADNFDH